MKILKKLCLLLFFIPAAVFSRPLTQDGPVALVLSGGGARGAYEIGVWRGLMDLGVDIKAAYGISVGAINSAVIAMSQFETARDLWLEIEKDDVMELSLAGERVLSGDFSLGDVFDAAVEYFTSDGIDVSPLKGLLNSYVDEDLLRESDIDFGLMTYSMTDFSEKYFYLEDIPRGEVANYIMASANFPLFQRTVIDGASYIDGGIYKNLPVEMIDKDRMAYAVLVSLNFNTPLDIIDYMTDYSSYDLDVVYISPSGDLGSILDFDPEKAERIMRMGYLDCLKTYGMVEGGNYFIVRGEDVIKKMYTSLSSSEKAEACGLIGVELSLELSSDEFFETRIKSLFDPAGRIEQFAEEQQIDRLKLYSLMELTDMVVSEYLSRADPRRSFDKYLDFISYLRLKTLYSPQIFSPEEEEAEKEAEKDAEFYRNSLAELSRRQE